jgi:hypothetical protein
VRIASLHTYPVKGCHRLDHDEVGVDACGPAGDRRWMIVDAHGVGVTQRRHPALATVRPQPRPDGGLTLTAPGRPDLHVPAPTGGTQAVRVFSDRDPAPAVPAAPADAWLTALLGEPARLVWLADPTGVNPDYQVSFADSYPILVATAASLDAVNDWLAETGHDPVPMTRFRPNVVLTGTPAWAEDAWPGTRLRLGAVTVRITTPSPRCVVTTVDQETGDKGRQPLKILGRRKVLFGVNAIPEAPGVLRVGDDALGLS